MASKTIPFPNAGKKTQAQSPSRDQAIAERTRRAVTELQGAMDEASRLVSSSNRASAASNNDLPATA